ncbi:MAG: TonB-dependent receptor [Tannerella sp.]|jgi:TonB-linked SusC/RagA family outer membrane protein|nr:TonB-dependent receptor [Tannerella sp.]
MKNNFLKTVSLCIALLSGIWNIHPALAEDQQTKTVTGTVLDIEGNSVIGANVSIKGTATGTATDIDGNYSIASKNASDVLVFSYLGFITQEIEVKDQRVINVVLRESSIALEDVVVVGYGTQKKVSVTGALSTTPMETIISVPTATFTNALGGHIPGLITRQESGEAGFDAAQIYIRGFSTWSGSKTPLILVDGVERDINLTNPQEVESFVILKDASATAVYGVRGANGVILINTKKGKKQKPKVMLRTEWATLTGMRFPNYIEGWEFASLMNEASDNSGRLLPWTEDDIRLFRDGSDPYLHPNVNWTDEVYKKTTDQSFHNLSITGGDEIVRYYVNIGYTGQSGLYKEDESLDYKTNSRLNRYTFRTNVDVNVYKDLVVDLGLGAIIQNRNYQGTAAGTIHHATKQISPISYPVRNPDGSVAGGPSYMIENPWALTTQSGYTNMYINTIQGTFGAKWDLSSLLTEGLSLSGKFAFDAYNFSEIFRRIAYGVKQYLGPDPVTMEDNYSVIREQGAMGSSVSSNGNRSIYMDLSLNYNRNFGYHHVGGLLLFNRREYVNVQAASEVDNIPSRHQGMVGRISYDYASRYLFEFNAGYNGSENFPRGKRYGLFPAVSAGWVISGENFWNPQVVSHLKIRGSYGQVGNDAIGGRRFLYQTRVDKDAWGYFWGTSHAGSGAGIQEAQIGVQNVTWETATKGNAGFDLDLFNGRASLQVDAFHEIRDNILISRETVPDYIGIITTPAGNLGKALNRGVDAMLEIKETTGSGFFYSFRSNFSFARNKILEDDKPEPLWAYQATKGKPIDQVFGYEAIGFFRDEDDIAQSPRQMLMDIVQPGDIKYKDVNEDGVVDSYDRVAIGYSQTSPEIMYGFGGTVAWKGFDATVYFTGAAHRSTFLDGTGMWPYSLEYPNYNIFREYYDNRWIPGAADNSNAKYPAVIAGKNPNNYQTSTLYMRDASFLRFQNAEIGYTIPKSISQKVKSDKIRVFINGTNLFVWDKIKIVDPEMTQTGGYPKQRIINFGAEFNF